VAPTRTAQRREEKAVEFSRIVSFSDGVFAIAITLLVLGLSVPEQIRGDDLATALWNQRQDLFAYALGFAVIGRFWIVHHRFFGDVVGFDGRLLGLNLFYLGWIVLIPFSSQVLGDHGGDTAAVVLYAVNLAGVILIGTWMQAYALRAGLATTSAEEASRSTRRAVISSAIFLASIPLALIDPHIAPYLWLLLFLAVRTGGSG
jgi:TMEM175 potassium channel family protein